jgi:hypothetical protein
MSRSFDGTNRRVYVESTPVTDYPFTLACWFKASPGASSRTLMKVWDKDSLTRWSRVFINSSGGGGNLVAHSLTDGGVEGFAGGAAAADGTWQHAIGVFAAANDRRVYLNGANQGSNTTSVVANAYDAVQIGLTGTTQDDLTGLIAHFATWNVALTQAEREMLGIGCVSPLMVRPQSLVLYAPYLGRDASDIDIVGGRLLTVSGATASDDEPPQMWLPGRKRIFLPTATVNRGPIYAYHRMMQQLLNC